jgi:Holliday junction resolvase RusA-like endonuclease
VPWSLIIVGKPAQKKNSPQVGYVGRRCPLCKRGTPRIFPDPQFRTWARSAVKQLRLQWTESEPLGTKHSPVVVSAIFYLAKRQHPDLDNLLSAVADVMQSAGIIKNDYWILSWGDSRRSRDNANPRVQIELDLAPLHQWERT